MLAMLLLHANRVVTRPQLVSAVWGDDPPASAASSLKNHVVQLRRLLAGSQVGGADRLRTVGSGYLLQVRAGELDSDEFAERLSEARAARQAEDWELVRVRTGSALALWRGDPLDDLAASGGDLHSRLQHLVEAFLTALEWHFDAQLYLGQHRELLPDLVARTAEYPLHETLHGQLMTALYRSGRQGEALRVFGQVRKRLRDELGVDPGPELRQLHRRLLIADPSLLCQARPPEGTSPERIQPEGTAPEATAPENTSADHDQDTQFRALSRPAARSQIPADTAAFVGRTDELNRLCAMAEQASAGAATGAVVISAIDGIGGIGKSALAVHAAHRLRAAFPDGQLFIDLHGHTPGVAPLTPGDALERMLRSLGVSPQLIPGDPDECAAFYRDRLADTRTLIVLDNAAGSAQVRPLLPAASGCLVLVTSRRRLTGLDDAHHLALDVLSPESALAMLRRVAGPGRVPDGDPAAAELVELCGRTPLAIRIVAARLRNRELLRPQDLVDRLRDEHGRLERLQDEDRSLAAVFESSRAVLPPAEQRLFRLLGSVPGPDIDVHAAANLLGEDQWTAERLLDSLLDHSMLSQYAAGRYHLHDLLRLHARAARPDDPTSPHERAAALQRLADYYLHTSAVADQYLARQTRPRTSPAAAFVPPPSSAPELPDRRSALAWMRAERNNLLASVAAAGAEHAVALTSAMGAFLQLEGPLTLAKDLHEAAVAAAGEIGFRGAEAGALVDLGRARTAAGEFAAAGELLEHALKLYRDLDDRCGEAHVLYAQGVVRHLRGDFEAARELNESAREIYRELGERRGEATALYGLGRVALVTSDHRAAADLLGQSAAIMREVGDRHNEANAHWDLGRVRQAQGDYSAAAELHEHALAVYLDLDSRHGEANTRWSLGGVRRVTGDLAAAGEMLERALTLFVELGQPDGEGYACLELARVRHAGGDAATAVRLLERALARFRRIGNGHGEANSNLALARVRQACGDFESAGELLAKGLGFFRDVDVQGETEALNDLGALLAQTQGPEAALVPYRRSLELARGLGSPLDEAAALTGIARCAARLADHAAALDSIQQAVSLYRRIGAADAESAAAFLAELKADGPAES
ncbi:BTAD domain-containing putative transcriptional regulator [Catenulispora yoronensis]|uniref:BTAD domain-containing putative transcriptional regulator n=1 Tax=Catenulispora yoronensis TaxID=450799 RepID=A0ABN2TI80_9ACTN